MKALVTGSSGFVGRHMVYALIARGYDVRTCDIKSPLESTNARDLFRDDNTYFDLVVHCAAVVEGREVIEGEPLRVASDLAIDSDMFQWAMRTRPGRVVYYSSSAAYPVELQQSLDRVVSRQLREDDISFENLSPPDMTYGWAKLTGELLSWFASEAGIPMTVLRPFSGYGSDQDLTYPFPAILQRAMRREDPLTVWSDAVRDFIHVDDVIGATLAAVDNDIAGPVNLCRGVPVSFTTLARYMAAAVGYEPEIQVLPGKPTGVEYRVGNPAQMLKFYEPTVSLGEGIDRALRESELITHD